MMENKIELQSHQIWVIETIQRLILSGRTRIEATYPEGVGHTAIIAKVMSDFKGRALFVTARREIADQFANKANGIGFDIGLCVAGKDEPDCACVCGTIQALIARGAAGDFGLVVIDDDILSRKVMLKKLLKALSKGAVLVSLCRAGDCATPFGSSGLGKGELLSPPKGSSYSFLELYGTPEGGQLAAYYAALLNDFMVIAGRPKSVGFSRLEWAKENCYDAAE